MTPAQIELVRQSTALVLPRAQQVATLFYDTLFTADPSLRPMFRGNMGDQGQRLMTMIVTAVRLLDDPDALLPTLRILGARHLGYGVKASHYDTVGQSLLGTLSLGLGEAFTPAVREAWTAMYAVVAHTMQEARHDAIVTD
jgi:hemoglobin-like flavoprotein